MMRMTRLSSNKPLHTRDKNNKAPSLTITRNTTNDFYPVYRPLTTSFDFILNDSDAPSNHTIKASMNSQYIDASNKKYCSAEDDKSFLHKYILADRERLKTNKKWAPRKWTSSGDFKIMCNVFGGSSKLCYSKLCFRCGAANSFEHSLRDCPLLNADQKFDFDEMFESPKNAKATVTHSGLYFPFITTNYS